MKRMAMWMGLCLALGMQQSAWAAVDKIGQILAQQREIREASERSTGAYSRFDRQALERMHAAQDRIFDLLDGVSSLDQLSSADQVEVFNSIEQVKAILTDNESSRQKCWREHKLGSNRPQTRCATVAELEQIRRGAEDWKGEPSICGSRGDGTDCGGNSRGGLGGIR